MDYIQRFHTILVTAIEEQASDIVISVGHYPMLRITGRLTPLLQEKIITPEESRGFAFALMDEKRQEVFLANKEIDFAYHIDDKVRFRVNAFFQKGYVSLALRCIPTHIKTIEALSLPPMVHDFTRRTQGLVLVTGASGQGKSTTLASMINEINHTRAVHIITIEDPIEYLFTAHQAVIEQREVSLDTHSFGEALRASFRQNPDVIMVGEMRDLETISTAITAAETGHLVFATLHTNSAAQALHRMIDVFPSEQQQQIRLQLASSLIGVISQRLIPKIKGGFVPACEIMLCNTAVATLIRENKIHEIPAVIENSIKDGMISLNRSLADLVRRKEISLEEANRATSHISDLKNLIR